GRIQSRAETGAAPIPHTPPAAVGLAAAQASTARLGGMLARLPRRIVPAQPLLRHLSYAVVAAAGFYLLTQQLGPFRNYQVGSLLRSQSACRSSPPSTPASSAERRG